MKTETKQYVTYLIEHDFDYWMSEVQHARSVRDSLCELDPNLREQAMTDLYRTLESNVQWDLNEGVSERTFVKAFIDEVEIEHVAEMMIDDANHKPHFYAKELNEIRQEIRTRQFKAVA